MPGIRETCGVVQHGDRRLETRMATPFPIGGSRINIDDYWLDDNDLGRISRQAPLPFLVPN